MGEAVASSGFLSTRKVVSVRQPLRGVDDHVAAGAFVADFQPAGAAFFKAKGAAGQEQVPLGGGLLLIHG